MTATVPRIIVHASGMTFRASFDTLEIWLHGEHESIALAPCRDDANRPEHMRSLPANVVGVRDNSATPPYIELFTRPPVRFEFPRDPDTPVKQVGRFVSRPMAPGYLHLRSALEHVGAMTSDLS